MINRAIARDSKDAVRAGMISNTGVMPAPAGECIKRKTGPMRSHFVLCLQ